MLFTRNFSNKYANQLLNTGKDDSEIASKKVIRNEANATGKLIANKIAEKIIKSKDVEEIDIPTEKREPKVSGSSLAASYVQR